MSGRKRPSGVGSNSRRFAEIQTPDGETLKIPVAKDVGTFLYITDIGASWPRHPSALLLDSASDLQEGALIEIEEAGAGAGMGSITGARIEKVVVRVAVDSSGRYSRFAQLKRLVFARRVPSTSELAALGPDHG